MLKANSEMRATLQRPEIGTAVQKSQLVSRADAKAERVKAEAKNWLKVCKAVDQRDKLKSRISGKRADPKGIGLLLQGHRHHIKPRSAGGDDTTENLILVTGQEHAWIHAGLIQLKKLTKAGADGAIDVFDTRTDKRRVSLPPRQILTLKEVRGGLTERTDQP